MTRRVLVVGARSMLGKRIHALLAPDHEVVTAGRHDTSDISLDLEDSQLPKPVPTDVAVICAASFRGDDAMGMISNENVNAVGPLRAAAFAFQSGCRHIVYASTIFSLKEPQNSYGLSKRHGQENLALFCDSHGVSFTSLLFTQLYDAEGEAARHQSLFYFIMESALEGRDVTLHGTEDPQRNYLYVGDAADLTQEVVRTGLTGTYPCLHPASHRVSEICQMAFETFGKGGQVQWNPDQPDIAPTPIVKDDRLFQQLGFRPRVDLRTGIAMIRDRMTRG